MRRDTEPRPLPGASSDATYAESLPEPVTALLRSAVYTEYGSVSRAGLAIDTPLLVFPSDDLATFNVATGLAYPAKAERARRNPKVGLLIEGSADEPVVSIAGIAAVRDSDIQANALRYIAEVGSYGHALVEPWPIARLAVWYWSRIIVEVSPKRILWWDTPADMRRPPRRWESAPDAAFPASDPPPAGDPSVSPGWATPPWRPVARGLLDRNAKGYLTLLDAGGFPLPIGVRDIELTDDSFLFDVPAGAPWEASGMGTLGFDGTTFVGEIEAAQSRTRMRVERMLPLLPIVADPKQVFIPNDANKAALMKRLHRELERRGLALPEIPDVKPSPTPGALRRKARLEALPQEQPGGD